MKNKTNNTLSVYDRTKLKPNILLPIPIRAIELTQELLNKKDWKRYGKKLLMGFSLKLVKNNKHVPFGAYLNWGSIEIRSNLGRARDIFKNKIKPLIFDELSHSTGRFSKAYRYKPEILEGGFVLVDSGIDISLTTMQLQPIDKIMPEYQLPKQFLESLDFQNCTLHNPNLLEDFKESSECKIKRLICFRQIKDSPNHQISFKSKKNLNFRSMNISNRGLAEYILLEEELLYQRKKYLLHTNTQKVFVNRDDTTFRLHHNLTALPSACIKYLSIDNEQLKEIDMKNCHYTLFSNALLGYNTEFHTLLQQSSTYIGASSRLEASLLPTSSSTPWPYMLSHFKSYNVNEFDDVKLFIGASIRGILYETIGKLIFGDKYNNQKREEVKEILMEIFYGYYNSKPSHYQKMFIKQFPNIYNIVMDLKANMDIGWDVIEGMKYEFFRGCIQSKQKKKKSNYKAGNSCLPILMMNMEAELFVDIILPNLQKNGFKVITKHDSVLVKESDYVEIRRLVTGILDKELGSGMYSLKD